MPGVIGRIGWDRSRAWHWLFSSTQITTAFSGGCRYRPATSRTLASSCGSAENLNPSVRCGARQNRRHSREIESWLTSIFLFRRSQSATRRLDQCVTPLACSPSAGGVPVPDRPPPTPPPPPTPLHRPPPPPPP